MTRAQRAALAESAGLVAVVAAIATWSWPAALLLAGLLTVTGAVLYERGGSR